MAHTNEENVFPYEKTLLNTIVKNTKETKVIQFFQYIVSVYMNLKYAFYKFNWFALLYKMYINVIYN